MGLSVSDLSCSRGGRPVLRGIGFVLGDGETLVLRGPNGAGKSTLLRALAGLLPANGRIELDGSTDPDARAELLAFAGHLDAVKLQLTVAENLAFWAALSAAARPPPPSPPSTSPPSPTGRRTSARPASAAGSASPACSSPHAGSGSSTSRPSPSTPPPRRGSSPRSAPMPPPAA